MDEYDLKARLTPGVAAVAPALMVAMVAVPDLAQAKMIAGSLGALVLAGLQVAALPLVRSAGLARQRALFGVWGGKPTTAMLRHRDTRINAETKRRLHESLRGLGPDLRIPSEREEQVDPDCADLMYEAAADEIRIRAKAKRIKTVHRENVAYGAARNLFGLKWFGVTICLISLVALGCMVRSRGDFEPKPADMVAGMADVIVAVAWLRGCTSDMVRRHGEAYALALFEAVSELVAKKPSRDAGRERG